MAHLLTDIPAAKIDKALEVHTPLIKFGNMVHVDDEYIAWLEKEISRTPGSAGALRARNAFVGRHRARIQEVV